jgi:outer membrane receptor protein involved in Fe transport
MNRAVQLFGIFLIFTCFAVAQTTPADTKPKLPPVKETVEVTATKTPEDPDTVPVGIQVFTGDELRARGVNDLRTALSSAIGVSIAPGGDAGPANSVPEFWGLSEFDAFLLVVDGVPWGGAFNPALTTMSLKDVERIEVMRGPAAVTYGSTSFVGVIQVVHEGVDSKERSLTLYGGSYASGGGSLSVPLPLGGDWLSRLTVDGERQGYADDRTSYRRGHALWRVARAPKDAARVWFNFDVNLLGQDPASPRPREGTTLSPLVPVDSNQNPAGAFLNDYRVTIMGGFDRKAGSADWSTTISVSPSRQSTFRGFLEELEDVPDNARGLRENIQMMDVYADTHFRWKLAPSLSFIAGMDYLYGRGRAQGADFEYTVPLSGAAMPVTEPTDLDVHVDDYRNFLGPYATLEWYPFERLRVDAGLRLDVTHESRLDEDGGAGTSASGSRTEVHPGTNIGAMYTVFQRQQDSVGLYAVYRDTFKPAAIDFGIGEGFLGKQILDPETARSVEGGMKARLWERRIEVDASGFFMNFQNLVTPVSIGGLPALVNAGNEHFKGFESGVTVFLPQAITTRITYSYHDARFTDFVQDFDGVPTQLAGNRLEMSALNLTSVSLNYAPEHGFIGGFAMNYIGSRYLNKRNTALAPGFGTVDAGVGYRANRWEIRVDGRNLGDARDPVAESELGEAQYYVMTARRVDGTLRWHF